MMPRDFRNSSAATASLPFCVAKWISTRYSNVPLQKWWKHIVLDKTQTADDSYSWDDASVRLTGAIDDIVYSHRLLVGPRADSAAVARVHEVISESHTPRQTTLLVRVNGHVYDSCWQAHEIGLEEIVLAYLGQGTPRVIVPDLAEVAS